MNRERELRVCADMLKRQTHFSVLGVQGAGGSGKSWFLHRIRALCEENNIKSLFFDFNRSYTYLEIMQITRASLGEQHFGNFDAALRDVLSPSVRIQVESGASRASSVELTESVIVSSYIGNIAGRDVLIISGNYLAMTQPENINKLGLSHLLTERFIADLALLVSNMPQPLVWLFDTFENVGDETRNWIVDKLLTPLVEGKLSNQLAFVSGRRLPFEEIEWDAAAKILRMDALSVESFGEYLQLRGLVVPGEVVSLLHKGMEGNPQRLAAFVDGYMKG